MFISKSKKLVKPKAPARRGVEATVTEDQSTETQPSSKTAEPVRQLAQEEDRNASGILTSTVETEATLVSRAEKQGNAGGTGEQAGAIVADTTHDEGASTRTRSGRRGAKASAMPPPKAPARITRSMSVTPAEVTAAPPAEASEPTALPTPPSTQASAGGFIRKSKKTIAPKAQTRRRHAAGAVAEENQTSEADGTTDGATNTTPIVIDDQAETDDVARRLVAALSNDNSVPSAPNDGSSSRTAIVVDPVQQENNSSRNSNDVATTAPVRARGKATQRSTRKRKQPVVEIEETPEPSEQVRIKKPRTKSRTASVKPTTASGSQLPAEDNQNDQQDEPKAKERKRKRASTPEDAESRKIEATEVRMDELIDDTHQGQVSQREKLLRQRDLEAKARKLEKAQAQARDELQEIMAEDSTDNPPVPAVPAVPADPPPARAVAAPQYRIVDGTIVSDESSRYLDRNKERAAAAKAINTTAEVTEEDDLSRRVNGGSFANYDKAKRWSPAATALFHKGLQYFGLEFSMMACLFPGRSRRQLKAKFIREERADLNLINSLLRDRQPVPSQEELEAMMGKKLKDPAELAEELRVQKEALEEAQRLEDERNEQRRLARERGAEEEGRRVISADASGEASEEERDDAADDNDNNDDNDGAAAEGQLQAENDNEEVNEEANGEVLEEANNEESVE